MSGINGVEVDDGEGSGTDGGGVAPPEGWARATLGDLLLGIEAGKSFKCHPYPAAEDRWGVIKVSAMSWGSFRAQENKEVLEEAHANPLYEIKPGDVLVSRANTVELVGAPVHVGEEVRPRLLLSDKSLRLVPGTEVSRGWLTRSLASPQVRRAVSAKATGTSDSMRNVAQSDLKAVAVLVPPVAEQHRIAAVLHAGVARLDAVERKVTNSRRDLSALRKAVFLDAVPDSDHWPTHWTATTTGEAGTVELGRARHPDWHSGPKMRPYLRVANVFEDRFSTTDMKDMDFSGVFGKYRLEPGDILLNEGQSPHLVGRPAMYRGIPEGVAFTNSLLRFRAGADVLPGWALLVFRRHLHAGRFMREVRITTNLAHLSGARLKTVEFPVPPLEEQRQLISTTKRRLAVLDAVERKLIRAAEDTASLRRALLAEAFSGRLLPQDPNDEPAEELLKRIRVEREASEAERKVARRPARGRAKQPQAASVPPPHRDAPALDGEQTALPLEFSS